jgi:hypothetical protein
MALACLSCAGSPDQVGTLTGGVCRSCNVDAGRDLALRNAVRAAAQGISKLLRKGGRQLDLEDYLATEPKAKR